MKKWLMSREAALLLLLIGLALAAQTYEPKFMTIRAQGLLISHLWELAIVAIPMLLIVMTGGIDLSVGANALSAVALGLLTERGVPIVAAAGMAVVVGTLGGALNGWFVARWRIHPLIVTLATMAAFRGTAEGISMARPFSGFSPGFLAYSHWAGWIFVVLAMGAGLVMSLTKYGRWIAAIGTEEQVSRFSGIPVDGVKWALYAFSGFASGLAATILVSRNNTAKADLGMGLELEVITAVVLSGAPIEGGKGNVLAVALSLLLIHETREFVGWHWRQNELNLLVMGGLLLLAVILEKSLAMGRRRRQEKI